jgi:hypothetical protein
MDILKDIVIKILFLNYFICGSLGLMGSEQREDHYSRWLRIWMRITAISFFGPLLLLGFAAVFYMFFLMKWEI